MIGKNRAIPFDRLFRNTDTITVGRVRRHPICLNDETVSIDHCQITRSRDGQYTISDNDSTNGIFVAELGAYSPEVRVTECVLKIGMHIRLGEVVLTPVDRCGEAPVIVKQITELYHRLVDLYGSFREAAEHQKPSRETLRRRAEQQKQKPQGKNKAKGKIEQPGARKPRKRRAHQS